MLICSKWEQSGKEKEDCFVGLVCCWFFVGFFFPLALIKEIVASLARINNII